MTQETESMANGLNWRTLVIMVLVVFAVVTYLHLQGFSSWELMRAGEEDPMRWNNSANMVGGEYILGTHDAYRWAAGGLGEGSGANEPPSQFLAGLSAVTGMSVGALAFWLPPLAAGVAAMVIALWAWALGGREAAMAAGILGGLAPGFFFRTRLGYFDTDMVTLLGPLLMSLVIAWWLKPMLHANLFEALGIGKKPGQEGAGKGERTQGESGLWGQEGASSVAVMVTAGFAARYLGTWHIHVVTFLMLTCILTLGLVLVLARPGMRGHCLWGLAAFGAAAMLGWLGLALGALITVFKGLPGQRLPKGVTSMWPALAAVLLVLLFMGGSQSLFSRTQHFMDAYSKPTAQIDRIQEAEMESAPLYPGVGQSIIEAQNIEVGEMLFKLHPWVWVGAVGVLGFVGLLLYRNSLVLIFPLLVLALLAWKYGTRTSMFGGAGVALGLCVPYCLAYPVPGPGKDTLGAWLAWAGLVAGAGALSLVPYDPAWYVAGCWVFGVLAFFPISRLLDRGAAVFAISLQALAGLMGLVLGLALLLILVKRADADTWLSALFAMIFGALLPMFWFANRRLAGTFRQSAMVFGLLTVILGLLLIPHWRIAGSLRPTPVLEKYHGLMLKELGRVGDQDAMVWTWWDWGYATNYYAGLRSFADGAKHDGEVVFPLGLALSTDSPLQARQIIEYSAQHGYEPWTQWTDMSGLELKELVDGMAVQDMGYAALETQYVVVSLENVKLSAWIIYFGLWDVSSGESSHPDLFRLLPDQTELDVEAGQLYYQSQDMTVPLTSMDLVTAQGEFLHEEYPENESGLHLLAVAQTGDFWLMGHSVYNSMLVRLLLCDSEDPEISENFVLALDLFPFVRVWQVAESP